MKKLLLTGAALLLAASLAQADTLDYDPYVIDPVSGELVLLSEIDTTLLTEEQQADLDAQLAALEDEDDKLRLRVGEDNGQGAMWRHRHETATRTQTKTQGRVQAEATAANDAPGRSN